jgi:hypothetical protein
LKLVVKIALGIILATLLLSLGGLVTTAGIAWWANEQIERTLAEQREQQAGRERAAADAHRLETENKRLAALRALQARQAAQKREREQNRIDRAFDDQYQPPPDCTNPQSNTRWVECVDIRKKAKAEFMGQQAPF